MTADYITSARCYSSTLPPWTSQPNQYLSTLDEVKGYIYCPWLTHSGNNSPIRQRPQPYVWGMMMIIRYCHLTLLLFWVDIIYLLKVQYFSRVFSNQQSLFWINLWMMGELCAVVSWWKNGTGPNMKHSPNPHLIECENVNIWNQK